MDANDRRVDHSNVPVVGFCDHVHQAVPHAGLPPAIEAIVDGRWRPITLRQVGPPSSRPQYPKNAVQYPAIIDPRHTARLIRQTRLDRLPLGIRQLIAAHRKPPVWELESRLARAGNPRTRFMSLRPNRATFKSYLVCGEQEQIEEAGRELAKDFLPLLGAGDCLIEPEVDFEGSVNPTVPTDRGLQINHHAAIPLNGLGIGRQLRHRGSERAEVSFTIVWSI